MISIRNAALAALVASASSLPIVAANAAANNGQTTQQACSAQYQAAKSAGTLGGQKWPQFYSDCAARLNTASAPAQAAPATATAKPATSARQVAATTSGQQTTQQICSAQYQSAKAAGTLNGQKWPAFLSACSDSIKSYSDQAQTPPPEPQAVAQPAATNPAKPMTKAAGAAPASTAGKTPGEIAFQQRIHECANEWQSEKAAGTLPSGSKWPQFWSACNTQLKARM